MAKVETEIFKPKRIKTTHLETIYRRHIFPMDFKQRGDNAVHLANKQTPTHSKFMAEISETETTFPRIQTFIKAKDSSNSVLSTSTY